MFDRGWLLGKMLLNKKPADKQFGFLFTFFLQDKRLVRTG